MSNRGYSGYYKGTFIRSSYEYVCVKILEHDKLMWKYEEKFYDLGVCVYLPDFSVYNKNNELMYIYEPKSSVPNELKSAYKRANLMKEIHNIDVFILEYEDLSRMCKERGLKASHLIEEWITSDHTTISKSQSGKNNGHYGMKHSEETKNIISQKAKERWEKNRERYTLANQESIRKAIDASRGPRVPRVEIYCLYCNKKIIVTETQSKKQLYCSPGCTSRANAGVGSEVYKKERQAIKNEARVFILEWALQNKELIIKTPYNKITTSLSKLQEEVEGNFGIKDWRVIANSVLGKDAYLKELLRYLKEYVGGS